MNMFINQTNETSSKSASPNQKKNNNIFLNNKASAAVEVPKNIPIPTPTSNQFPKASIVNPQQPQQNFLQSVAVKAAPIIGQALNFAKETAKQVVDFIPKIPGYGKAAVNKPRATVAGAGSAILKFGGSIAGAIEHGIASTAGIDIPERWDVTKQIKAFDQGIRQIAQTKGIDEEKAVATGQFIGSFLPYTLASEVAAASIGTKLLLPTAAKFMPGAIKFIPSINNTIGFIGIGQIEHNPENGSRINQFRNDLINLALFETGAIAARGLTKGTRGLISKTVNEVKDKPKVDFEITQPKVTVTKNAIKKDLGKPMEVAVAQQLASGKVPLVKPLKPVGEGSVKVSRLGLKVEQTAIEKKLTTELGDLPQYKQMSMKDQASKANDLLQTDPDKALRVALGQEVPTNGLLPESVFKALESSITTPEMARTLATSPLVEQSTALGQKIKALDVQTTDSPVSAMKQIIDARKQAIETKYGNVDKATAKVVKDIQSKIKTPDKYDWNKFIEGIRC
jgi:hypothetical protein